MPDTQKFNLAQAKPPALLLHYSILLTGFGTVFLGPLLPSLTASLHTDDRGGGALLAAQFAGAFLGGWTTRSPLGRSMVWGYLAALAGFAALGWCSSHAAQLRWFLPPLVVLGYGIGQLLTSVNLLASRKWINRRGAALTLLNFTWSIGALTAPLMLLRLLQLASIGMLMEGFALLLIAGLVTTLAAGAYAWDPLDRASETAVNGQIHILSAQAFIYYAALLFIYGGVETSISGWLTTYDARYGSGLYHAIALSTTVFWICLTGSRAVVTAVLLRVREVLVLRAGLVVAMFALISVLLSHSAAAIAWSAGLLGTALSPWFPLVLSQMVGEGPAASQAGKIIAVSGLGAAVFPWLVGWTSTWTGSLRAALVLPIAGIATLLLMSVWRRPNDRTGALRSSAN